MAEKPTYEELEYKVKELEKMVFNLKCELNEKNPCNYEFEEHRFVRSIFNPILCYLKDSVFVHAIQPDNQPGPFIYVNEAACLMLGYTFEELTRMSPWDLDDIDTGKGYIPKAMQDLLEQNHAFFEAVQITKQGRKIHVEVNANVYEFEDIRYIISVVRDITERKQAEKALRQSEKKLSDIIDFLPDATLAIDLEKRVIIWNKAIEEMTGIPASDMLGRGDYAYTIPFYGQARPQLMDLVFEDSKEIEALYPSISRNGDTLFAEVFCKALYNHKGAWVIAKASPLHDDAGKIIGAIESIRDITDWKQAEKAFKDTNKMLQQMLDGTQDVIAFQYPDHTIIRYNQAGYELLGKSPEEVIGKKCYELIGRNEECEICPTRNAIQTKSIESFEKYQPEIDKYIKITANPIFNEDGELIYIIEQITDISNRKKADEALINSEKRFRKLLEDVEMVAVQGYDKNRRVFFWNYSSEKLYGYTKQEALGSKLEDLIIPDHMRDQVIRDINAWLEKGQPIPPGELELQRKDGSLVPVYSSHVMQEKSIGEKELYCIDVELTEIKKITDQLIKTKEQAEAANRAKSEFLANMSHEIRTPLNGILGMLQLIQDTSLNEELQECSNMAIKSTKRLNRLLTDILDLTKIETEKLVIREEEFALSEVMQSLRDIFTQVASRNGNDLNIFIKEDIPETLIGDSARLTQILFNLVGNASKYTHQGKVDVHASFIPGNNAYSCRILFNIKDTGKGIAENKLDKIFETFSQASDSDSPYTRQYEGAGLGLPLVKRLVRLMGGVAAIESEEGEGTSVYVSLPFEIPEAMQQKSANQTDEGVASQAEELNILLAEDDAATQLHIKRLLQKQGYKVTTVEDGEKALAELAYNTYDLVLMDIQMPVLDGVEATKKIRSSKANFNEIPIIALTAYAMLGDREKFLRSGMNDYIAKPVDKNELIEVIERNVSK